MNRLLTFVSLRSAGISFTSPARRNPTQHVLKIIPSRATKRILYFETKNVASLESQRIQEIQRFLFLIASLMKIFFMQPDYPSSRIIAHTILHTIIP